MKTMLRVVKCAGLVVMVSVLGARQSSAQITTVGYWNPIMDEDQHERGPGPEVGDYSGLPINAATRLRADTWDASLLTLPEHQCQPHPSTYGFRGVGILRVWETRDPETQQLVKYDTLIQWQQQHREIWMDGRPVMFHARIAAACEPGSGKRQTKSKRSSHHVNKVGRAVEHYVG